MSAPPYLKSEPPYKVLFLCTGNSARSILAEAILRNLDDPRFHAFSAGSRPKGEVHPQARDFLEGLGIDTAFARSKSWEEFAGPGAPGLDFIFTVCDNAAGETCPIWPGHPISAHWGVPDPAAATGTNDEIRQAFADAFDMLTTRISRFAGLPIETLDRSTLQKRLQNIGASQNS